MNAGLRSLRDERAQPRLHDWLKQVSPFWDWDTAHSLAVQDALQRLGDKQVKRLMIFAPVRHGKSQLSTIRFAAWLLDRDPSLKVCVSAYDGKIAKVFSRGTRRIIAQIGGIISEERKAQEEWETTAGGMYRACGVGAPPTGQGFDFLIVDDPIRNREQADSEAMRENVWEWYEEDLLSRLEPGGCVLIVQTRWHLDDLAGRIIQRYADGVSAEDWEILRLPALAESQAERDEFARRHGLPLGLPDPIGREAGEALWESRWPRSVLQKIERERDPYSWASLYQQNPVLRNRNAIVANIKIVQAVPATARRVRYWDKAGTEGAGAYTVGLKMARSPDGRIFIEDIARGQWSSGTRERMIKLVAGMDGKHVRIGVEQEPGSGGKDSAKATIRRLAGYDVHADRVTGSKETRMQPFLAQIEAGNVHVLDRPWKQKYLEELGDWPSGKYKDQCDASSGALSMLAEASWATDERFLERLRAGKIDVPVAYPDPIDSIPIPEQEPDGTPEDATEDAAAPVPEDGDVKDERGEDAQSAETASAVLLSTDERALVGWLDDL